MVNFFFFFNFGSQINSSDELVHAIRFLTDFFQFELNLQINNFKPGSGTRKRNWFIEDALNTTSRLADFMRIK